MPICIECRYPVPQLYHVSHSRSKSTTPTPLNPSHRSSTSSLTNTSAQSHKSPPVSPRGLPAVTGTNKPVSVSSDVKLTQCPRCKRFADKYVEHDYVVIFIDLVLIKPQVYRHILFNRFSHEAESLDPAIRRLGTLLILFDVYLTMIHIERQGLPTSSSPIFDLNVFLQWGFFVFVCFSAAIAEHLTIRSFATLIGLCGSKQERVDGSKGPSEAGGRDGGGGAGGQHQSGATTPGMGTTFTMPPPATPTPSAISTALFVSSCMSLFPILMIVWRSSEEAIEPSGPAAASSSPSNSNFLPGVLLSPGQGVGWVRKGVMYAVGVQNLEALRILLGCGYIMAGVLVLAGGGVRFVVRSVILGLVGMTEN